jgi:hypothetical protein
MRDPYVYPDELGAPYRVHLSTKQMLYLKHEINFEVDSIRCLYFAAQGIYSVHQTDDSRDFD